MSKRIGFKNELVGLERDFNETYEKLYDIVDKVSKVDEKRAAEMIQRIHDETDDGTEELNIIRLSKAEVAGLTWFFERLVKGEEPYVKIGDLVVYNSDYAPIQTSEQGTLTTTDATPCPTLVNTDEQEQQ